MLESELMDDKTILQLCNTLEDTNKTLIIHSDLLPKFNFIHKNVEYNEYLPNKKQVYLINNDELIKYGEFIPMRG